MKAKISIILCLLLLSLLVGCQKPFIAKPAPISIPPNAKVVCIFFDDAFQNQYDVALPILLEYNFKASFGVITDHISKGRDIMEYMGSDELRELANYGMDIASHTETHPHLRTLSDEQVRQEIFDSKKALEELGLEVSTFIYPYYEWDDRIIDYVIAANYSCARGGWTQERVFSTNNTNPKARYHVAAWQISNQDINGFKTIINQAGPNTVVCLVYHIISDEGPEETTTPINNFKEQMSYLKNNGFTIIPLPDIFRQ